MDWYRHRFRSRWDIGAPPDAVYAVLVAAEDYPRWWPQVREAVRTGDTGGAARIRSLIPYDLWITAREERQDPAARVIQAALGGDVEGWARWIVTPRTTGTRVFFEQSVVVRKPLLRRLAVPGRPFFRANHALMMCRGRRGLRARLAGAGGTSGAV
ncbi:SRPBCC family protein [Streptomyces pactum]|uniref:SRPBCC family protein n=1 Tax=Streptomyces pactum TaxID=68249 RepID=A0ABS0NRU6_9ACTN|nr:SRPBCC family protein [Streptomyces pactum]MBH5337925.1 SRPBCC family protein [Streptomyces pactum]